MKKKNLRQPLPPPEDLGRGTGPAAMTGRPSIGGEFKNGAEVTARPMGGGRSGGGATTAIVLAPQDGQKRDPAR
jgi:hypothetical protein